MSQDSRQQSLHDSRSGNCFLLLIESSSDTNHTVCDWFSPNCHHFPALKLHFRCHKFRDDRQVETVVARRQITRETDDVEKSEEDVRSCNIYIYIWAFQICFSDRPSYIKACRAEAPSVLPSCNKWFVQPQQRGAARCGVLRGEKKTKTKNNLSWWDSRDVSCTCRFCSLCLRVLTLHVVWRDAVGVI